MYPEYNRLVSHQSKTITRSDPVAQLAHLTIRSLCRKCPGKRHSFPSTKDIFFSFNHSTIQQKLLASDYSYSPIGRSSPFMEDSFSFSLSVLKSANTGRPGPAASQ
ncbi:UNVERIFIED_CONTAM: hypothetical protein K2H54_035210 [Gekko kuhli]